MSGAVVSLRVVLGGELEEVDELEVLDFGEFDEGELLSELLRPLSLRRSHWVRSAPVN